MVAETLDELVAGDGKKPTERRPAGAEIDDRLLRWIGIPAFALAIPQLTGLYGPHGPRSPIFWLGTAWFLLLSFTIWHGNRWLLFKTREHVDWFDHPLRKIALLLFGVAFGTIPVTVAMLLAWSWIAGLDAPDRGAIAIVTLINVICVVFVTHVYETVFLIKAREDDRLAAARLERARVESELEALRAQVDPHFLFNSLNTLSYLIREDRERAVQFNDRLARVYRYLTASRGRQLVLLAEELELLDDYAALLMVRFGAALQVTVDAGDTPADRYLAPPASLQLLVENAVKHNEASLERPLRVELRVERGWLTVANPRQPRGDVEGARLGLANLAERVRLTGGRELQIEDRPDRFTVRMPLLAV